MSNVYEGRIYHTNKQSLACVTVIVFIVPTLVSGIQTNAYEHDGIENIQELMVRGHIAYAFATSENLSGFVEFDLEDPGNLTGGGNASTPGLFSAADFDFEGNLYCVEYSGGIYLINIDDGTVTFIAPSIGMNGLCFDTTSSTWYGSSSNQLYLVNVTNGATISIGSFGITNTIVGIACDNNGSLYGYDILWSGHSTLYAINKSTGQASAIGDMGYGFVYAQDPAYDRDNDILYIAGYFNDGSPSALLICDTQTGACTMVDNIQYGAALDAFAIPFGALNQQPIADFTWSPLNPLPGETILFDGSGSYDPDGYIILYEWDWDNDGECENESSNPTAIHVWTYPGSYRVVLQVTDNASLTRRKTKTVNIINNPPPTPIIGGPSHGTVNHPYPFSLGAITDPEGNSFYCQWDWGDGNITDWLGPYPSGQMIVESHTWIDASVYEIRAKLKDTYGAESGWSEAHIITISDNKPPDAPTMTGPAKGKPNISYLYTFETTDPENDDVYYYIDWGDSTNSSWLGPYESGVQKSVSHSWSKKETYIVKIKAKDVWGVESDWNTLTIKIPCSYMIRVPIFFDWLIQRFPHAFPILRYVLTFYEIGG